MKNAKFRLQDFHPLRYDFPDISTILQLFDFTSHLQMQTSMTHYTKHTTLAGYHMCFGLGCFRFARRY
jgi:hypothetical protein